MKGATAEAEGRVLLLMPTARDGERSRAALEAAGIPCAVCKDLDDLCREICAGAGAALLTEEALTRDRAGCLSGALREQPPWSDFPLIVLCREGAAEAQVPLRESMNVTLVERPLRMRSLLSVVRAALRSRRHQYAVREHLAERVRAEQALHESDRRKDEFIAMLAHELRNPLAPLRNGLQVVRLADRDQAAGATALGMMERQLTHMVRLIDDLLDVSRITRNKMELRRSRVALADAVGAAVETAGPLIDAAGHRFTVSLPAEPVWLDADLTRLAQVFANLLANSAKYTRHGGEVWLTAKCSGSRVEVTVRDTGIGIPDDAMPHVFDMFSQLDRSIERSTGGLGIGLALVKGLVEMHGGSVRVASGGPGKGSAFTVTLPLISDSRLRISDLKSEVAYPKSARSRRVLVVDDNRDSAESMALMLQLLGNEVATAHDGVEAVEAAGRYRPEVVLMDVGMPRLNGLDATRRIREQPWGRSMAVIALTGWGQDADRERSREAGCDGHLVKPVDLRDLERLLADLNGAAAPR